MFLDNPELTITEDESSLLISVRIRHGLLTAIGSAAIMGGFAYLVSCDFISRTASLGVAAVGAMAGLLGGIKHTRSQLRVTNLDFEARGQHGCSVPRMSIRGLEYESGGEDRPAGLYAGNNCLLPNVTEEQVATIINRIYDKFPDTPTFEDPYGKSFTTLILK